MKPSKMMLFVAFAYLLGPNTKVAGAMLGDMLLAIFLLTSLVGGKLHLRWKSRMSVVFIIPFVIAVLATVGKVAIGLSFSMEEVNNILRMLGIGIIGAIGASQRYADPGRDFPKIVRELLHVLAYAVIAIAFLGFYQKLDPDGFRSYFLDIYGTESRWGYNSLDNSETLGRITSVFLHPNALGAFSVCAMAILILNRNLMAKGLLIVANVLGFFTLLLTNSRISLLLFGVSLLYFMVAENKKKYVYGLMIVVGLLLAFVPLETLIGETNYDRLVELQDYVQYGMVPKNLDARFSEFAIIYPLIKGSNYLYFGYPTKEYMEQVFLSWDNQYLGWLIRYGLLSIILIAWQIYLIYLPYKLQRARIFPDHIVRLLRSLVLVNILLLIGGISQDTALVPRWREFNFLFSSVVLTYIIMLTNSTALSALPRSTHVKNPKLAGVPHA